MCQRINLVFIFLFSITNAASKNIGLDISQNRLPTDALFLMRT